MKYPFHMSIGVQSITESQKFFTEVLGAKITHQEASYCNVELFQHQITLKPVPDIEVTLPHFHFGINMSLVEFEEISKKILKDHDEFVAMKPKVVDKGTSLERRKMYLKCPTGYTVEIKGYGDA